MAVGNCSVEAAVIENGKSVKGTLTLFIDEYVFGSKRKTINWEKTECKKGTVTVKGFLRSAEKPCVTFTENGVSSPQFVLEQAQFDTVMNAISSFVGAIKSERAAKERLSTGKKPSAKKEPSQ